MTIAVAAISVVDARESVAVARSHGEKFFEQIVWQVENEAWAVLGYASWDAMRAGEYGDMGVVAPRADRPELVARLKQRGLPNTTIATTLGVDEATVRRDVNRHMPNDDAPATITNARGQERPASYTRTETTKVEEAYDIDPTTGEVLDESVAVEPRLDGKTYPKPEAKKPPRRALTETSRDAGWELRKTVEKLERIIADDRFTRNKEEVASHLRSHLQFTVESCQGILDVLNQSRKD